MNKNDSKTIKINAMGKILGRLASEISFKLRGKNEPSFNYNTCSNNKVIVYNIGKIIVTGKKPKQKKYYRHSGYLGGLTTISYEKLFSKSPCKILYFAVKNMLPKNKLQNKWLKNLTLLKGEINVI